jgi:hypothetical protein
MALIESVSGLPSAVLRVQHRQPLRVLRDETGFEAGGNNDRNLQLTTRRASPTGHKYVPISLLAAAPVLWHPVATALAHGWSACEPDYRHKVRRTQGCEERAGTRGGVSVDEYRDEHGRSHCGKVRGPLDGLVMCPVGHAGWRWVGCSLVRVPGRGRRGWGGARRSLRR